MTIEKGQPWGESCRVPAQRIVVGSDRELALCTKEDLVSLTNGDLWKSLGSPPVPQTDIAATQLPIDALIITIDDDTSLLAASTIEIGSWFRRGRYICIANTSFAGQKNIAPRAHPNDGSLDYLEITASMSWRQRWLASRRALTGTHIPHPQITTKRIKDIRIDRESSELLRIDGVSFEEWRTIHVQIDPDHWQVLV